MRTIATLILSAFCTCPSWSADAATIETIAGTGRAEDGGEGGPALETNIGDPFGVEIGPDGALYICEVRNHRVRRLNLKTGALTTVAGSGQKGYAGDGGPATKARLNEPYEVRFDLDGNMLFVEMRNHVVRRVDAKTGLISTVAGTGREGFGGDGGPAIEARLSSPHSIALDSAGNIYIADIANHRIRRVEARTGNISTIAGNGEKKLPQDSQPAADRPLIGPRALFIHGDSLWIALREGHSVWKLNLTEGLLQHVAGTGKRGYSGDGGLAKAATFDGPKGIAIGPDGRVYVVDTENHAVRRVDLASGQISTVAGSGPLRAGSAGDGGPAIEAMLNRPHGICLGMGGEIYIGDTLNHRIRVVK
jgi:DNA-binding beta-propeller fold protein YncE